MYCLPLLGHKYWHFVCCTNVAGYHDSCAHFCYFLGFTSNQIYRYKFRAFNVANSRHNVPRAI
ncbi:hypothetical protein DM860_015450 [Cuscuta australis]|uniref:Uncharacterized protein n=1 Tax=Cuscuta australis TaxID=267555 RepID=A0A328E733_9ASTE|nr:hypothetical protein DM860_015450 [Cuscuta australis]